MNFKNLEALYEMVHGGGVAAAAKRLHRTQPQISRLLAQLEEDAGFQLLRKEGRRLVLTPEGYEFYKHALGILELKDALSQYTENVRLKRDNRLHITAANHMIEGFLIDTIIRAHALRPDLSISINARMPLIPQSTLGSESFDIALAQLPIDHPALIVKELASFEMVVVMHPSHRLAKADVVTRQDIAGETYACLPSRSILRGRSDQVLNTLSRKPNYQFEASFASMVCQLVAGNCGITIAEPLAALAQQHLGLVLRRFKPAIPLHYGIAYPSNQERAETSIFFEEQLALTLAEKKSLLDKALQ